MHSDGLDETALAAAMVGLCGTTSHSDLVTIVSTGTTTQQHPDSPSKESSPRLVVAICSKLSATMSTALQQSQELENPKLASGPRLEDKAYVIVMKFEAN